MVGWWETAVGGRGNHIAGEEPAAGHFTTVVSGQGQVGSIVNVNNADNIGQLNVPPPSTDDAALSTPAATLLRRKLEETFSLDELRTLAQDLAVDYEQLPGQTKGAFARELINYLARRGRLDELLAHCRRLRPLIIWPDPEDQQQPPAIGVGSEPAHHFYQALRAYLIQTPEGQQMVDAFEADPGKAGLSLADYLAQQWQADPTLSEKLRHVAGQDSQLITIVNSGQVDQIVNVARVAVTVNRPIFSSVLQVMASLLILLLVAGAIAAAVWQNGRPAIMTGDFNIAVAEFSQETMAGEIDVAPAASGKIFDILNAEYQAQGFENVQVAHERIGPISNATEAAELAEQINADLVIYGRVTVFNDEADITPIFHVSQPYQGDLGEFSGQHTLNLPLRFVVSDLLTPQSDINTRLKQQTIILAEYTKALVYLSTGDLPLAQVAIERAIAESEQYAGLANQEVLYLIASDITRRQKEYEAAQTYINHALTANPEYGRAYIARANLYYDQRLYPLAQHDYQQALELPDQPFGAYLPEKANLGLGNCYLVQFLLSPAPDRPPLALQSRTHFQVVIDHVATIAKPEQRLLEMAAWAYYNLGLIAQEEGQWTTAQDYYNAALARSQDDWLKQQAQTALATVQPPDGSSDE